MKVCTKCKENKELTEFYKDKQNRNGLHSWCKSCVNFGVRKGHLKRLYDITLEEYNEMFAEQAGCCVICKRHQSEFKNALCVDHDAVTGQVRALLCSYCNVNLVGKHTLETAKAVVKYLESA